MLQPKLKLFKCVTCIDIMFLKLYLSFLIENNVQQIILFPGNSQLFPQLLLYYQGLVQYRELPVQHLCNCHNNHHNHQNHYNYYSHYNNYNFPNYNFPNYNFPNYYFPNYNFPNYNFPNYNSRLLTPTINDLTAQYHFDSQKHDSRLDGTRNAKIPILLY